ncbi:hypothetical protein [Roseibacillus persicicus]|nr:hypothetical protein [Roseibacillus persicicus]
MKTLINTVCASLLLFGAMAQGSSQPTGFLDASSLLVRASSKVGLTWEVNYPQPEIIDEIIEIDPEDDTVTTRVETNVTVRLLGAGYANSYGQYGWQESWSKFSDEAIATPFFVGTGDTINPQKILKNRNVDEDIELNFGFRGCVYAIASTPWYKRTWNDWRMMGTGHGGILILKNGDPAPQFTPEQPNQTSAKTFLKPYLTSNGENISIGTRDVIILVDLNKDSAAAGADYQDLVILMTFKETEELDDEDDDDDDD